MTLLWFLPSNQLAVDFGWANPSCVVIPPQRVYVDARCMFVVEVNFTLCTTS